MERRASSPVHHKPHAQDPSRLVASFVVNLPFHSVLGTGLFDASPSPMQRWPSSPVHHKPLCLKSFVSFAMNSSRPSRSPSRSLRFKVLLFLVPVTPELALSDQPQLLLFSASLSAATTQSEYTRSTAAQCSGSR